VEQALQVQADEGELIPVDRSAWAAPIVVVHKHDGGIRICGDFKVTVNPVICSQTYPLPTPEEMFSTLANGESYFKLDLARAYKTNESKYSFPTIVNAQHPLGTVSICQASIWNFHDPGFVAKSMAQVLHSIPGVVYFIDDMHYQS